MDEKNFFTAFLKTHWKEKVEYSGINEEISTQAPLSLAILIWYHHIGVLDPSHTCVIWGMVAFPTCLVLLIH